jgi:hypothetical protein
MVEAGIAIEGWAFVRAGAVYRRKIIQMHKLMMTMATAIPLLASGAVAATVNQYVPAQPTKPVIQTYSSTCSMIPGYEVYCSRQRGARRDIEHHGHGRRR